MVFKMAQNSKRERLILSTKAILDALPEIKSVKRTLQAHSDLSNFALTQLPICAVVGRLPVPVEKSNTRNGEVDQIISLLKIDVVTYFQSYDNEDIQISNLGDTIFAALYTNQNRDGLALTTHIKPHEQTNIWTPFVAFKMVVEHTYLHNTGGF